MVILISILFIFIILLVYACWNMIKKNEAYEELIEDYEEAIRNYQSYYSQITEAIQYSDIKLKQVDHRGAFKSDDEIGYFFKLIQDLQMLLNSFDYTNPEIPTQKNEIEEIITGTK